MTQRMCKDWLTSYIEYCEDFEPPAIFQRWMGILCLSVATGHRVWLEEANMRIWPNLYVVLVGPSGIGKGQAMREALPFLEKTGVPISPDKITIPKLTKVMAANAIEDEELGLYTPYLIWAEELPSFLGQDAYKSGKLADLTTLYDCAGKWESGTKHQGDDIISQPYVCMGAGATASGLFDVVPGRSIGQGFTSRLMFVASNKYPLRVAEKPWYAAKHGKLLEALQWDIEIISRLRGAWKFSDYARVWWNDYYLHRPNPTEEYGDERMQGYAARKPFYAKKLALLLAVSEAPKEETEGQMVESEHLERAMFLLKDIDNSMTDVYGEMTTSIAINYYAKLLKTLMHSTTGTLPKSELAKRFAYAMDTMDFQKCLQGLQHMGLITSEYIKISNERTQEYIKIADKTMVKNFLAKGK